MLRLGRRRALRLAAMRRRSAALNLDRSVPLVRQCRSSRLLSSFVPRSQGEWESQKQTGMSSWILSLLASSMPRSQVSDCRRWVGQL